MVPAACAAGTMICVLVMLLLPARAQAAAAPSYGWASPSLTYVQTQMLLTPAVIARGPAAATSRRAFVSGLVALDERRALEKGAPSLISGVAAGATLSDVQPDSIFAKAVTLGWISPVGGAFAGGSAITATEASKGVVGALGLRDSAVTFSLQLRAALPGVRTRYYDHAVHVYARALKLRYNHLQGTEQLERSPNEPLSTAHSAYMLHQAAIADDWRISSVRRYETFTLPALGPNQKRVLVNGVKQLGMPYVWAGETEGSQPEGHGGFDCSGFVWRTTLNGGLPAGALAPIRARTSMTMSAEGPKRRRIKSANLRPGDLMFWGDPGTASRPQDNFHAGIYMGNGWFIHSSGGNAGVTIDTLDGWWAERYSWGRRVLRTA